MKHLEVGQTLGATRDAESDSVRSAAADAGEFDEDGVEFDPLTVGALDSSITVNV